MRPVYGLGLLLETKRMARSTFYYHLKPPCAEHRHAEAERRITEIFHQSSGRYGYRRIAMQLRNEGIVLNHKTVLRLMRKLGLSCRIRQKRYRSYRGTVGKVAPNSEGRGASFLQCWTCSAGRLSATTSPTGRTWRR